MESVVIAEFVCSCVFLVSRRRNAFDAIDLCQPHQHAACKNGNIVLFDTLPTLCLSSLCIKTCRQHVPFGRVCGLDLLEIQNTALLTRNEPQAWPCVAPHRAKPAS